MNESNEVDFCSLVGAKVSKFYGLEDGADLCFNLLESGVITQDATVDQAARIVAMHIEQA